MERPIAWNAYDESALSALEALSRRYRDYLDAGKTERECVTRTIEIARAAGYVALEDRIRSGEKLRAGETREQIFDFMVARYGEQIRYEPDMNAGTAALWAAPWVALGACGLFLAARMRRKGAKADRA